MRDKIKDLFEIIIDAIFPRRCAVCDRTIKGKSGICSICEKEIRYLEGALCMKCGKQVSDESIRFCYDCRSTVKRYNRGFAIFEYEYIKNSIYKFKYSNRPEYGSFYALKAYERLGNVFSMLGIEAFIPVPIHKKRFRKRGYNQAEEFARELSKLTGIITDSELVVRGENTIPLKKLSALERQKNLKKAFKLTRNDVKFSKVCIVDDIYTTGATIDSIAVLLKRHGALEVYFVTVAIGKGV